MYIHSQVSSPAPGQLDAFKQFVGDMARAMAASDIPLSIKASVTGTAQPEVYLNTAAPDLATLMKRLQALRESQSFIQVYEKAGRTPGWVGVDSFMARLLPGYDETPSLSEGTVGGSYWKPYPGRLHDLQAGFLAAKKLHEKHGATRVRGFQVMGGRYSGCYMYLASYPSLADLGKGFDAASPELDEMLSEAFKNPSAELVQQMILDNPVLVGRDR